MNPITQRALAAWPLIVAEILLFGITAFTLAIAPPDPNERRLLQIVFAPLSRALSVIIILFSSVGLLIAVSEMADVPLQKTCSLLTEVMAKTHVGRMWTWRLGLGVLLIVITALPAEWLIWRIAMFALTTLLLLLESLSSHAIDKGTSVIVIYFIHEIAAGLWIGALFGLWFGFVRSDLGIGWAERAARRVSRTAGYAVAVLMLTGIYNAYDALGLNSEHLFDTIYGHTLLLKLVLFAAALGIGAYNRYRLIPAAGEAPARRMLLRNVAIESVLLIGALGMAALLANTPPPHGAGVHATMAM